AADGVAVGAPGRRYRVARGFTVQFREAAKQPDFVRAEMDFELVGKPLVDAPAAFAIGESSDDALQFLERGGVARHRETVTYVIRAGGRSKRHFLQEEGQKERYCAETRSKQENRLERAR